MISRLSRVAFLLLFLSMNFAHADGKSVTVLIHNDVKTTELTSAQLRKIFSMRQTLWPDGTPIVVFVLPSQHPAHQALCKDMLKMFPYQVERIWNKLAYSGLGEKPIEVSSEQEMLERLRTTPGAIGYVMENTDFDNAQSLKITGG
ncbi:substrate-binding domain-containing protein [Aliiglaciecola litoralis]|uniref:PBP domain-containing protein n=1 Tax=Aliiglaciecola litoralis TaxID=582857 RepID=A0ABN1LHP6_9ALTE